MSDYVPHAWVNGASGLSAARLNNIESGVDDAHEELQHSVTFTVAANNSSTAEKATADYLCDGTADQVEINNAIDAARALGIGGGEVVLLGGVYNIAGSILMKSYVQLEGVGRSTYLTIPNATNTTFDMIKSANEAAVVNHARISNLCLDGNKANQASGVNQALQLTYFQRCWFDHVLIYNMKGAGIILQANSTINWVEDCYVSGCDGSGISLTSAGTENIVSKCYSASNNIGIVNQSSDKNTITDNHCVSNTTGIDIYDSDGVILKGNHVRLSTGYGIITESPCNYLTIKGNQSENNGQHGLYIAGTSHSSIIGNLCYSNGTAADVTYDNIRLTGVSTYNNVQANVARRGAQANKAKWGLRINVSDCLNNFVTNNDLYDGGSTAAYSDAGTGTNVTAGNRTA